jgi:DNA-binding MarR family transcriptional regulator
MSRTVASLEAAGYVCREPDPRDGRAVVLHATPKGRRLMARGRRRRVESLVREVERLPEDELAALERAVRVLRRLEAADPDA